MPQIRMKEEILNLILSTTAYGIPNILTRRRIFNKLYWFFFLITSSIISFYYTYTGIVEFYKYEVVTEIKHEYDQPSEFPTITICSLKFYHFDEKNMSELIKMAGFGYDYGINFDDHFELLNTSIGACLRFNSGRNSNSNTIPIKNSTFGGLFDSFSIAIDSPDGLAVWIHNKTSPPKIEPGDGDGDDPITIMPGFQTNLAIEKIVDQKLEEPYNDCIRNVLTFKRNKTIVDFMLDNGQSYSQIKCINICFDLKYIENNPCNCTTARLGKVWLNCWQDEENSTLNSCTFESKKLFFNKNLKEYCSEYCPLECYSISFKISINILKSLYFLEPNITLIKVFYRNLKFTYISQKPKMLFFDVLSNVGGTLGLFVGLSFVSLFEIIEILLELIFTLLSRFF
jgi:hypothetical protein